MHCVLPGPLTGPAQGIFFHVVFTIGQTLPLFPASIGYARWVPTTPTGNLKWEYSMASAQILALGPFYSAPITSYSNASPWGSFSANHDAADSAFAKTLR